MSTIATGLVGSAEAGRPYQRKAFYAVGRYWVFTVKSSDMVFYTSQDGTTWSSSTIARNTVTEGEDFSVWFDGTFVHYAFNYNNADGDPLVYRRGTPNSNGTITWSAVEQTVVQTAGRRYQFPVIVADSNGNTWIACTESINQGSGVYRYYPTVIKNDNTDGTWSTAAGFPFNMTTEANAIEKYATIVPLTNGKIGVVYSAFSGSSFNVLVRTYTGSAWNTAQQLTSLMVDSSRHAFAAVAVGDDVEIAFLKSTERMVRHVKLTYSTNTLGTETTLYDDTNAKADPSISKTPDGDLYVFWQKEGVETISYSRRVSGTWDASPPDLATGLSMGSLQFNSFYQTMNGKIAIIYTDGTSLIWNEIDQTDPTTPSVTTQQCTNTTYPTGTTVTANGRINATGNDPIIEAGFVYATTRNPTTSDTKINMGSLPLGAYSYDVTGLVAGTLYYVRAYARNSQGTAYGAEVTVAGDTIYPIDPLTRVSGIRWIFDASIGKIPDYYMEVFLGGVTTSYVPAMTNAKPVPAITPEVAAAVNQIMARGRAGLQQSDYESYLRRTDITIILRAFGKFPSFADWLDRQAVLKY